MTDAEFYSLVDEFMQQGLPYWEAYDKALDVLFGKS